MNTGELEREIERDIEVLEQEAEAVRLSLRDDASRGECDRIAAEHSAIWDRIDASRETLRRARAIPARSNVNLATDFLPGWSSPLRRF